MFIFLQFITFFRFAFCRILLTEIFKVFFTMESKDTAYLLLYDLKYSQNEKFFGQHQHHRQSPMAEVTNN